MFSLKNVLLLPSILLAFVVSASAATFVVNTTADTQDVSAGNTLCADAGGNCSLRAAITEANALAGADVITLPAGTYTQALVSASENLNAGGDFDITSDITINGAGSGTTIIEANAAPATATERVIHCITASANVFINDVTIRHGNYNVNTFGGGIRLELLGMNLTLNRVVVTNNRSAGSGGGIHFASAGTLSVNGSTISNNSAGSSLAGTAGSGAGINVAAAASTANITDSTITGNTINSSVANTFGAGLNVTGASSNVSVLRTTISNNSSTSTFATGAGFAGGIYNQQATLIINNSTISGNSASSFHAGIRTLASTTAVANTTITESTIRNNTAVGEGGGVVNIAGAAFNATTNIIRSTVSGNMATSATSLGGGVENFTVSTGLGTFNLTNSTVSGNSANDGAGIYNSGTAATVNLNFSTVASNTAATQGGGLSQSGGGGVINLKNSIVGDNLAPTGPDIFGTITSQDYNHVENTSGGTFFADFGKKQDKIQTTTFFALANDVTGTDPQLLPLANNGGPTLTHLPVGTSPVINTIPIGTNDCGTTITTSQNLGTRPQQTGCEKGSVERVLTAAGVSIAGRVTNALGSGIPNTIIELNGGILAEPIIVRTNSFGHYKIENLPAGLTYILTVRPTKQFQFSNPTRIINADENITGFDFISD